MSKYSQWILENKAAAAAAVKGTGIFPELLLAQAIIESAKNGKMPGTQLAKQYNNYFGIKAFKSWQGDRVNFKTGEFTRAGSPYTMESDFRAYKTPLDSFKDYVKLLQNKRYKKVLAAKTIADQARELKAAGYSTAPDYASKVSGMANVILKTLGKIPEAAAAAAVKAGTVIKENKATSAGLVVAAAAVALYFLSNKSKSNGRK